jgi:hypothetical protein
LRPECADYPFGIGLRFGAAAAAAFVASPEARRRMKAVCAEHRLAPFTMNAFPYGTFHNTAVKEDVYRPTWGDPRRIQYTADAAYALAMLMPEDIARGSVSTAPLSYKTFHEDPGPAMDNLALALQSLRDLHHRTGKRLVLSIEPEPGCFPETTPETIQVVNAIRARIDDDLADYLGVCLDTAHLAVEFEDLAESARQLTQAGIAIGKCQISAALECDDTPAAREALARFVEGTYLHQTIIRTTDGSLLRYGDLPEALASPPSPGAILRTHFHVPLHEAGLPPLRSTVDALRDSTFIEALAENGCNQFEVETYTWNVWRQCVHSATDIDDGIARELDAAATMLKKNKGQTLKNGIWVQK